MTSHTKSAGSPARTGLLFLNRVIQPITMGALFLLAIGLSAATLAAAFGAAPWLTMPLTFGDTTFAQAGIWVQTGITLLAVGLCSYLPANMRIQTLEHSHRSFRISMHDVAHAYHKAHTADREGAFRLSHEFDAVRERIAFLRDHPDLDRLEPEIIEAAAQMSFVSRDLADVYSEEKVNRARGFLKQRQEELEQFNDRLEVAKVVTEDLRHWLDQVEMEESVARSQLDRLLAELDDILPELNIGMVTYRARQQSGRPRPKGGNDMHQGTAHEADVVRGKIIGLPKPAAE